MASGQSNRHHRGASLVEFALIAPVLFLILLGTLTGGLTLSRQNSVKNAVREATRFGAVLPDFVDVDDNLDDLYAQTVAAATGDMDPGVPSRQICVALIEEDDKWYYRLYGATASATTVSNKDLVDVPSGCSTGFDAAVGDGTRRVWIRAERKSNIEAILYSRNVTLEAQSLGRYER